MRLQIPFVALVVVLIAVLGISAFSEFTESSNSRAAAAPPDPPQQTPVPSGCNKRTVSAGKCGADIDAGPVQCGSSVCYQTRDIYGLILNCDTISDNSGRRTVCGDLWCVKTVLTQACNGTACEIVSREETNVVPNTYACGETCPPES